MKLYIISGLCILVLFVLILYLKGDNGHNLFADSIAVNHQQEKEQQQLLKRLRTKADSAKGFIQKNGYASDCCLLIDFSIHSGKKRFFVWDFKKDSIMYSGLCCHGYGQKSTQAKPVFSNNEGSYCSSLGKYKIGIRSYSNWGINVHYKMHGLEKSNSNAYKRIVVLHSHDPVPDAEIYPRHLQLGYSMGCPVIANDLMRKLDTLLKNKKKPVLMWIYN